MTAMRRLKMLEVDRIIELVTKGDKTRRMANEYRYVAD